MFLQRIGSLARPFILLLLLGLSLVLLANTLVQKPGVQGFLIRKLSEATGYQIHIRIIELNLWHGLGVLARDVEASTEDGTRSFVASRLRVILDTQELLRGHIVPLSLYLHEPQIILSRTDGAIASDKKEQTPISWPIFWLPGLKSIYAEKAQVIIRNSPYRLEDLYLNTLRKEASHACCSVRPRGFEPMPSIVVMLRSAMAPTRVTQDRTA